MRKQILMPNASDEIDLIGDDTPEVVRGWIVQVLLRLGAYRRLLDLDEIGSSEILDAIGIRTPLARPSGRRETLVQQLQALAERHSRVTPSLPAQLAGNIERVGNLLGLIPVERRLLGFAVLARTDRPLWEALDLLGSMPTSRVYRVVAVLINASDTEVRDALSPRSTLCRTGLVTVDRDGTSYLQHKLDLLSDGFAERMTSTASDPADLLRDKVFPSPAPTLSLADFTHVRDLVQITHSHLSRVLQSVREGTNVLIHGIPGVGKTELARVMAAELGVELFEISSEDVSGDPLEGDRRLRAYRAAQCFFAKRRLIFLFDEAEDVFAGDEGFFKSRSSAQRRKAWMNRTLEHNSTPAIWVSNSVDCLDPAFVRRFDIVIELANPPPAQRETIIRKAAGDLALEESLVVRMASDTNLTPAIVARAADVTSASEDSSGNPSQSSAMELLVNSTLRAQGHSSIPKGTPSGLPDFYSPRFINAEIDLAALAEKLHPGSSARILLHGPSGTGKTAYARWLTKRLGMPLIVKRASDLLSKYVGQAERNLAAAFEEASRDGSVLLLDEVDTFLQDRRNATASWEVSMVNEMLTQMESFSGLMLASTNLMPALDNASIRRFDLKVGFHALRREQLWEMFTRICEIAGQEEIHTDLEAKVRRLAGIVPGDFAIVVRQHALSPFKSAFDIYSELVRELSMKEQKSKRIGFI